MPCSSDSMTSLRRRSSSAAALVVIRAKREATGTTATGSTSHIDDLISSANTTARWRDDVNTAVEQNCLGHARSSFLAREERPHDFGGKALYKAIHEHAAAMGAACSGDVKWPSVSAEVTDACEPRGLRCGRDGDDAQERPGIRARGESRRSLARALLQLRQRRRTSPISSDVTRR